MEKTVYILSFIAVPVILFGGTWFFTWVDGLLRSSNLKKRYNEVYGTKKVTLQYVKETSPEMFKIIQQYQENIDNFMLKLCNYFNIPYSSLTPIIYKKIYGYGSIGRYGSMDLINWKTYWRISIPINNEKYFPLIRFELDEFMQELYNLEIFGLMKSSLHIPYKGRNNNIIYCRNNNIKELFSDDILSETISQLTEMYKFYEIKNKLSDN